MNQKMKSLVTDGKSGLSIQQVTVPEFGMYQALIKMESCGICNGTDLKIMHGTFKNYSDYPAMLGHEGVGIIVEKGVRARHLKIGDRILLPFVNRPVDGYYTAWGAFSEYGIIGDGFSLCDDGIGPGHPDYAESYFAQLPIPSEIDAIRGCMLITFREVLSGCNRFGLAPNRSIVIFGAGPVGCCFIRMAKLLGMGPIISFDVVDEKVRKAEAMGADYAYNSMTCDVAGIVSGICPDGVDFALDAVGINTLINLSMKLVKNNGKICSYGISPKLDMQIDWSGAPYNWQLHFHQFPSKIAEGECHRQVLAWVMNGVLDPDDFISDIYAFSEVIEAFSLVEHKKAKGKIVIRF